MSTLKGTKIIEIAGIGPAPFAGMLLADMGAEVILVDRKQNYGKGSKFEVSGRGKKSIACLLYTSPSPRDVSRSRMPSSA